jgi:hypothetical protein
VDSRAGLDDLEKTKFLSLPGLELRPLSRPARSQSLYRLRYRGRITPPEIFTRLLRAAAHQLRQDKHQDMRQKKQKLTSAS